VKRQTPNLSPETASGEPTAHSIFLLVRLTMKPWKDFKLWSARHPIFLLRLLQGSPQHLFTCETDHETLERFQTAKRQTPNLSPETASGEPTASFYLRDWPWNFGKISNCEVSDTQSFSWYLVLHNPLTTKTSIQIPSCSWTSSSQMSWKQQAKETTTKERQIELCIDRSAFLLTLFPVDSLIQTLYDMHSCSSFQQAEN
jgi:hypothetical protein